MLRIIEKIIKVIVGDAHDGAKRVFAVYAGHTGSVGLYRCARGDCW